MMDLQIKTADEIELFVAEHSDENILFINHQENKGKGFCNKISYKYIKIQIM